MYFCLGTEAVFYCDTILKWEKTQISKYLDQPHTQSWIWVDRGVVVSMTAKRIYRHLIAARQGYGIRLIGLQFGPCSMLFP